MIKRIILSLLIIAGVSASGVTATKALLSDQATLTANTFSTGTVDLKISTSQALSGGTFVDQKVGFTDKVLPGQTISELLWLKNSSSDVDFAIAAQAASISGELNPADVTVAFTPMDDAGTTAVGSTVSHTLDVWVTSPTSLGTPNIIHGDKQRYKMEVTLASSVSSAGSIIFDFIFTGTQTP